MSYEPPPPPFLLDLRSTSGPPITVVDDGDGGELTIHQWTSWLRIRSDVTGFIAPAISDDDEFTGFVPPVFEEDGIAVLIHMRNHQDLGGEAVGLHHARVEFTELEQVREAVASIDWPNLPRPIGGDYNAPNLTLRYASGNLLINRGYNARSGNFIEAIAPLRRLLDKLMTRTMCGPSGTVEPILDITADEEAPQLFRIRVGLRSSGIGPVVLTDPRLPTSSGTPRLELAVGERVVDRDWVEPFEWMTLELPPLPEPSPSSLLLATRRRWQLELPWLAPKPGSYELRMRWRDYDGPLEAAPDQVPFMPVPATGPSWVGSGPYPVRGSCSATLRFDCVDPNPARK
jgi:hypothetical protein